MFRDDFTHGGGGSTEYLTARSGWARVAGSGADYNANVQVGGTALTSFPDSGPSLFRCTDQAAADHYIEVSMLNACGSFIVLRAAGADDWVGFRLNDGGDFQCFKSTTAGGTVQLGGAYASGGASGQVCRMEVEGNTVRFFVNGTQRCGSPFTVTENAGVTRAGVLTRSSGVSPWIDYFETGALSSGTPAGMATETDTALALAGKQIRALGLATETDAALALSGSTLAGLPFNTAPYEFGQRTGLDIEDFALYASTSLNISVFAEADVLLASRLFAYTESTGSDGRLTRKTHASLTAGSWYIFVAVTAGGAQVAAGRIQAT